MAIPVPVPAGTKMFDPSQLDPKTGLVQFCQRYCHRSIAKEDIVYNVVKYPQGIQATVTLTCIDGQEFAGEVCPDVKNQKQAERSAAQQALIAFQDKIAGLQALSAKGQTKKKKKRAAEGAVETPEAKQLRIDGGIEPAGGEPGPTCKNDLNAACSKIARRVMQKNEIHYEVTPVALAAGVNGRGFQATVRCSCLPNGWDEIVWTGDAHAQKKDAEQSAALNALTSLQEDPQLAQLMNAPPKPKNWPPPKGKGKGKGGGAAMGMGGINLQMPSAATTNLLAANTGGVGFDPNMYQALIGLANASAGYGVPGVTGMTGVTGVTGVTGLTGFSG